MTAPGAADALSRRPLSSAFRPFIALQDRPAAQGRWRSVANASKGEGFRAPAFATVGRASGPAFRKPPREETARLGTVWRARLWGFVGGGRSSSEASATGGGGCFRLKRRRAASPMTAMRGSEGFTLVEGGRRGSRGHPGRVPARGRMRKRSTLRGGMRGDGHEVSILIRLGEGDRAGRGPSMSRR
jgi:hypothetical protein